MASHAIREVAAKLLIAAVHLPWRGTEVLLRRRLPAIEHYLIMRLFRAGGGAYPVTVRYPNPLTPQHQITMHLDLCENNHQWHFRLRQRYELPWVRVVAAGMAEAGAFVDVGANVGVFALTIAQAYPQARVVAVEPLRSTYEALLRNVALNGLSNVTTIQAAVAAAEGAVPFYVNPIHDGGGSLLEPTDYRTGDVRLSAEAYRRRHPDFVPRMEVPAIRLDELIQQPSVIKVDVEGTELDVLESGASALAQGLVNLAVVEVRRETIEAVVGFLDSVGFDCYGQGQQTPLQATRSYASCFEVAPYPSLLCRRRDGTSQGRDIG